MNLIKPPILDQPQDSSSVCTIIIADTSSCSVRKSLITTTENQIRNELENKMSLSKDHRKQTPKTSPVL